MTSVNDLLRFLAVLACLFLGLIFACVGGDYMHAGNAISAAVSFVSGACVISFAGVLSK